MTNYRRKKMSLKDEALKVNDKIDAKVDGLIDKGKSSRFSWIMIGGAVVVLLALIGFLAS